MCGGGVISLGYGRGFCSAEDPHPGGVLITYNDGEATARRLMEKEHE